MLLNFLLTSIRSFKRNKTYTIINILGLSIGISGIILMYTLYDYELSFDSQYNNTEDVFRVNSERNIENTLHKWGITPPPLGADATAGIPGIDGFCRLGKMGSLIRYGDNIHNEELFFADPDFVSRFQFPLYSGNLLSFNQKSTALISYDFARKFFGDEDPVGKQLEIIYDRKVVASFMVGGVLKKVPRNSSFHFSILVPYDNVYDILQIDKSDWAAPFYSITYLFLNPGASPALIETDLQKLALKNNELREDWKVENFYLIPFHQQKDESKFLINPITWPGLPVSALYGSAIMNLILFLIAAINFTNTSVAYARNRLKEIGLRKTFGGTRRQVIFQFMLESGLQCLVALLIAMYINSLWVNWLNTQWPIEISSNYITDPALIFFLILLLLAVTVLAGSYPAFYVAKFQPGSIIKGNFKYAGTSIFSRSLLTYQYGFSIIAVFAGITLVLNARYQNTLDWGFDKQNIIIVPLHDKGNYDKFHHAVKDVIGVSQIAATVHNVSFGYTQTRIDLNGRQHEAQLVLTGKNYINTVGLRFLEGRNFNPDSDLGKKESVLVNQSFVDSYNITHPMDQTVKINGENWHIIGVVKNYMPAGLSEPVKPLILKIVPDEECTSLCVKIENREIRDVYNEILQHWKGLFPDLPFNGYYQEESFYWAENTNISILKQFLYLAVSALIISSTGLFSMVSLSINKRTKEIGIRKVLGASIGQIITLVNREFIIIFLIASLIGLPSGYFFMRKFLSDIFTYHTDMGLPVFILSILVILISSFLASGEKMYRATRINPVDSLRYE